jgi:hypothetical protein
MITVLFAGSAHAQDPRIVVVEMHPTDRAQIAVWIEDAEGRFLRTLALTRAVAYHGIGNRPGASQMNSGFLWPYGRRDGVLPVWGHRRAAAPGAIPFGRVIFQNRASEGYASRTSSDHSPDDYFCLSFMPGVSAMDQLDAVTCPSIFNSDKGRYLTASDVASGYSEPFEMSAGAGTMMPLEATSLYPPRRDVERCDTPPACYDHADVERYRDDARRAMPEIDAVTMATPPGDAPLTLMFSVPGEWEDGEHALFVEVNTEGDYNSAWGPSRFPTPRNPSGTWDSWAIDYGYPYRGQPSVVYRVPFLLTHAAAQASTTLPLGYGAIDGRDGEVHEMDGTITDDPSATPGSGADRLRLEGRDFRVSLRVMGPEVCRENLPPGAIEGLAVTEYAERRDAHRYAHVSFVAPDEDFGIARYEVRVSTEPIVDDASFERALQAEAALPDSVALQVPTMAPAGGRIDVDLGGLAAERRYYVAVRAVDICNVPGAMAVTDYVTPEIEFTTVSPCFVATAAYGTPMADEIGALRRFRDRHLRTNALGRALVSAYETFGPHVADAIRGDDDLRSATRALLAPIVAAARALD